MIVPVVLSGGSGSRLWPLSTPERPKQFLSLCGSDSMFRQTLQRLSDRGCYGPPVVVANAAHERLCLDELAQTGDATLILEPCPRNTAAAILLAALEVQSAHGPNAVILVSPSDHRIGNSDAFHEAVGLGRRAAEGGWLVTFGIVPDAPETGYGYLESGAAIDDAPGAARVERFTEKPDRATAEAMIAGGRHYWNGGIFLYRVRDLLEEAERHAPKVLACVRRAMDGAERRGMLVLPDQESIEKCPDISVDYAIMERSDRIAMVPLDADWSDLGSWDALADLEAGSDVDGLVTLLQSNNCYVRTERLKVALLGVDDLIVISSGDQLVVMRRGESQHIRKLAALGQSPG